MINRIKTIAKLLLPKYQKLILEYPVELKPRFGYGKSPHSLISDILESQRPSYEKLISEIIGFQSVFSTFKDSAREKDENQPAWNNGYLPGLDIVTLYAMISHFKPVHYFEIGSGNSTKVARKSISNNGLKTKIISIDPQPRANIDVLADEVIREPLENLNSIKSIVDRLQENDILFIDNSHRCLPNSDATVCFLELLPYLKKGVIVHFHDIYLPFDYPQFMCDRFYSEQYVLAGFILANPEKYKPIFPAQFISNDKQLTELLNPFWSDPAFSGIEKHGGSFWIQIG